MATEEPQDLATPSLPQLLEAAIQGALEDVHTCSWGSVLAYDAVNQRVDVQIINRRGYVDEDGTRQTERPAPLLSVPVLFPGAGSYSITWPIAIGDVVLLVFAEHARDAWHLDGQDDVDAGDDRRHSLSDAFAIPGLRSMKNKISNPPTDAMCLSAPKVLIGDNGATKEAARKGDTVDIDLGDLQSQLDLRYQTIVPPKDFTLPTHTVVSDVGTISSGSSKVKVSD